MHYEHSRLQSQVQASALVAQNLLEHTRVLGRIAEELTETILGGGIIYACGNGGSAAQAQHFVAELVGRFHPRRKRQGYAAVALTTDTAVLTAVGNDFGYDQIFLRQAKALMTENDALVCFSTSGNSANVVNAGRWARTELGARVFALTGLRESALSELAHYTVPAGSTDTARIQEAHLLCVHLLCDMIERSIEDGDGVD
jgi:D-sedoheptulose 7-phosphate isomerase